MKTLKAKSVDEYIAAFPKKTQALLKQMRAAIKKAAPTAEEIMSRPEVNVGEYVHLVRYSNGLYYCHSLKVRNGGDCKSAAEAAADFWLRAKESK